jgi:hypothetical protein
MAGGSVLNSTGISHYSQRKASFLSALSSGLRRFVLSVRVGVRVRVRVRVRVGVRVRVRYFEDGVTKSQRTIFVEVPCATVCRTTACVRCQYSTRYGASMYAGGRIHAHDQRTLPPAAWTGRALISIIIVLNLSGLACSLCTCS